MITHEEFAEYSNKIYEFGLAASDIIDLRHGIDIDDPEAIELIEEIKEVIEQLRKAYNV